MTLEDFFTLTELKHGLTAPDRVKELIDVLQKDKHNAVKNVGDSTRQWSAVASTIASTENKDCLALFLQLDGLCYFDTWLKHGQKCFQETGDSSIEESIIVLLGAIDKLHTEEQKSVMSGIMMTIKDLLSNNSLRVQDRARALFDGWKQNNESNVVQMDVDKDGAVCGGVVDVNGNGNPVSKHEHQECSSQDISTSRCINNEEKYSEPALDEITPAIRPETMQTKAVAGLTVQPSDKTLDRASINDATPDPVSGNPSKHQLKAATGIESSGSPVKDPRMLEGHSDVANSNELDEPKPMLQIRSCSNLDSTGTICADSANAVESIVRGDNEKDVDVEKGDPCLNKNSSGDVRKEVSQGIDEMYDNISPNSCNKISASDTIASVDVLQGSSLDELNMGKSEGVISDLLRKEDTEAIEELNGQNGSNEVELVCGNVDITENFSRKEEPEAIELSNDQTVSDKDENNRENEDLTINLLRKEDGEAIEELNSQNVSNKDEVVGGNDPEFSMSGADLKHSVEKKSDFQLDYDMFDPLEVARQVAIEVEREVDCREPSCSSSERMSGGGIRGPESPDSMKGKDSKVIHPPCKDMSTGLDLSAVAGDKVFVKAKSLPIERENCIVDIEPTGVSDVAQKIEPNKDKHVCGFDLNEDMLCDDDTDNQTNPVTAPISLVSASRAAATSGLALSPLQFDGTRGWKGSAETSAFRPAPMHKVSEGENSIFASGSSSSLLRRSEHLDFDLNVAESEVYKISADMPPSKETPNSAVWPSGESSLESCQKRSGLQLDLNCISDSGGDAPSSYWRKEEPAFPHFNGQFSPSASSSSSSMQPSLKNIDLNDQPSPFTEFLYPALTAKPSPNLYTSGSGGLKTDESVISLMGARVEVRRKDNALSASMTRNDNVMGLTSSSLYAHPYMYGYSGPSAGLGGQIPYMVDSRGTPVAPQVLGPVPALPPSFPQQPSFFERLAAAPADSNGFVPPGHGFDLNLGVMTEGRSRDAGNALQLLNLGQGISTDEQMKAYSQSTSSSGIGGKRKETDGGWDPSPFNYKHHQSQPPWK